MGPLPPRSGLPLDVHIVGEERGESYVRKHLTYAAEANDRVPAYLLIPDRTAPGRPAVVCLHQTVKIGKAEPAGLGGNSNLHYAHELALRGYVAIAPDYPNFGDYHVDPYAMGYASATMKGIVNHRRAIDLLAGLPQVNRHRIAAVGHSLGGHNALFLAAFDSRVKAVVTSCGFTSFRRYMKGDLTGWSHRGYMPRIASDYGRSPDRMPFDFSDVLRAIGPRPVFVNAPLRDSNFDWSGVDDAVRESGNRRVVVKHPDSGHEFPPEIRREAWALLDNSLR